MEQDQSLSFESSFWLPNSLWTIGGAREAAGKPAASAAEGGDPEEGSGGGGRNKWRDLHRAPFWSRCQRRRKV